MSVKYVFVTGGVVSGLGKGITAASLGRLLKARGYKVTMQKFDPYINIDPGTMNPIQHGEVFVTDDGAETDLDLGHYERFIDESLTKNSNVTTGKVYWSVLTKERRGDFGGGTVQVIPHITNEIKSRFHRSLNEETEIAIIEVGGTVGDIESQPYIEAIRQFQHDVGHENCILIHVALMVYLPASEEMKTKPIQMSVKELQRLGIQPDIVVCRTEFEIDDILKDKISLFCNVPASHVVQNLTVDMLYEAPLAMEKEHLAEIVCESLNLDCPEPDLDDWEAMVKSAKNPTKEVTVALVGKYIALHDAYISVVESLKHAGYAANASVNIKWVDSETVKFFLYGMVLSAKKSMQAGEDVEAEEIKDLPVWKCLIFIGGGLVAIVIGGQIVVNCSETIARGFGLSETLIGLTICSIGTSLPELVTSVVAAKKNQAGMALGNVIGSNIFNILLVGGLASAISPIGVNMNNIIDIVLLIIISLYIMILVWKKQLLTRAGGMSMLVIYAAYMVYICAREVL